jgi:hypothetical protein
MGQEPQIIILEALISRPQKKSKAQLAFSRESTTGVVLSVRNIECRPSAVAQLARSLAPLVKARDDAREGNEPRIPQTTPRPMVPMVP